MKLGIFGGTFNPVHRGHIELACEFVQFAGLQKVILIPTKLPPHKSSQDVISGEDRLNMCRLAVSGNDKLCVSDIELRREGKSYTVDTVRELQKIYPEAQLYLIVGADMLLCFDEWREYREIIEKCVICTAVRNESTLEQLYNSAKSFGIPNERLLITNSRIITVSSTQIRERIRHGESISELVASPVENYIKSNGLYLQEVQ